jgi:glycosyltransferase involved in cell wall biosynthesis
MKRISLIIPCYNEAENIPQLIKRCEELAAQVENIEVVLVDNGSTDNTLRVLENLASSLSFIRVVRVEINQGYGHGILSGLRVADGEILGWTHADMQTDPVDLLKGVNYFKGAKNLERKFVKGKRYGRPIADVFFTMGMAIFETLLLRRWMWDINAQPTMFHREFFLSWENPPEDFSLDLYAYYMAKKRGLKIYRFPVLFGERAHGISHWNVGFASKYKFIKRTLIYSFNLQRRV